MGVRPIVVEGTEVLFVSKDDERAFTWAGHSRFIVTGAEGEAHIFAAISWKQIETKMKITRTRELSTLLRSESDV